MTNQQTVKCKSSQVFFHFPMKTVMHNPAQLPTASLHRVLCSEQCVILNILHSLQNIQYFRPIYLQFFLLLACHLLLLTLAVAALKSADRKHFAMSSSPFVHSSPNCLHKFLQLSPLINPHFQPSPPKFFEKTSELYCRITLPYFGEVYTRAGCTEAFVLLFHFRRVRRFYNLICIQWTLRQMQKLKALRRF